MRVWTTRSGQVLHATASCPSLEQRRIMSLAEPDALPVATRCTTPLCRMVFGRAKKAAA